MARQQAVAEVNAFVKGLITEASPMTFPDNASIDEQNFVLNRDGSRKRRNGMDYEAGYTLVDSGIQFTEDTAVNTFVWKQPGGYSEKEFSVVQTGRILTVFDNTLQPLSANKLLAFAVGTNDNVRMTFTSVDGILIVASGQADIINVDYNGTNLLITSGRLKIRDLFGIEDYFGTTNLLEGSGLNSRPGGLSAAHCYNLRNQTFALPRLDRSNEVLKDPIQAFFDTTGVFPSNSDNVVTYLYADANDADDRNSRRYWANDNAINALGSTRAPLGYFVIDALDRGASRLAEVAKLMTLFSTLNYPVTSLPADRTPGGASAVSAYAGRVWYGGFTSQIIDGDSQSPRMTSYVLFSKLVQGATDIYKCYQDGDPTSSETPDLLDTDGGFLRLDGAFNIQQMVNVGDALMVIAENGVWKITGGSGYGFKATDYVTSKITEHGCVSPGSVVVLDNTFMYWSDDGIYHVNQNQYGDWIAANLSNTTIQTFYDGIPYLVKTRCQGLFDSYQRQVRWLYYNYFGANEDAKELILDANLSAFYTSNIQPLSGDYPRPLGILRVPPFKSSQQTNRILSSSGFTVTSLNGSQVTNTTLSSVSAISELYYLTADSINNNRLLFSFSSYRDLEFLDWKSKDGVGIDAPAYLVTGWTGMGDFQRMKQVSYLTVYSVKTETGFDSSFNPRNESSVIVQGQWGWTNSASAGKWTQEFQAYRHKRLWIPPSSGSTFDDGEYVVTTKNKLRGRGRVLSIKFRTEPKKDFHLLGWSYLGGINGTV